MNVWDVLILLIVGLMVYLAVKVIRSGKGSCRCGGCDRNCAACGHPCESHKNRQ